MGKIPDFLVLGAQKCGTTSFYEFLCGHPQVTPAAEKELHFFDRDWHTGLDAYRECFRDEPGTITGEATPYYLFHPEVPDRVAKIAPDARFLVLLRDPIDRAYSHHQMQRRLGRENLTFEAAIEAEPQRLATSAANRPRYSYLARGRYVEQLERWFDRFGRGRFLVLETAALRERPAESASRVADFLGIDAFPADAVWPSRGRSSYAPLSPATREALAVHFEPHNEALFRLLGERFAWRRPRSSRPSQAPTVSRGGIELP
ncbi:MAG: sulfotransferase [Myxococcales bacterium]|nr:sulfotransferase [Myxococcales bacterium]